MEKMWKKVKIEQEIQSSKGLNHGPKLVRCALPKIKILINN